MFKLTICLDEQMHSALMQDASRHLRPTIYHAKALLRQALGLTFPYPDGFDECDPATWNRQAMREDPHAGKTHEPVN
jgi:hypothetical protein